MIESGFAKRVKKHDVDLQVKVPVFLAKVSQPEQEIGKVAIKAKYVKPDLLGKSSRHLDKETPIMNIPQIRECERAIYQQKYVNLCSRLYVQEFHIKFH